MRRPLRWAVAIMVGGLAFVSYVERMNISIAAEQMMPELAISKIEMGHIFSSFLLGYLIFQIPAGKVGDKVGPRITLALAAIVWGITSLLTGLVPNRLVTGTAAIFSCLMLVRFVPGAGEAATFPVGALAIRNWLPRGSRALGNSLMMVGSSFAAAVTAPVMSWLTLRVGWRAAFYDSSLLAFGIAVIWYISAPQSPDAPVVLHSNGDRWTDSAPSRASTSAPLTRLLADRNILMLTLSYTCEGYVLFIFVFWLYIYLVEVRGFSMLSGGFAASLPWITALVFTLFGGWICDSITAKKGQLAGARTVIMVGYGLSGIFLFGAAKFDNRLACLAALCMSVGFLYFAEPAFWATAIHLSGENAGAVSGLMNTAGIVGALFPPLLHPVIVKYFGWMPALGSGAVVAVACTCAWGNTQLRAHVVDRLFCETGKDAIPILGAVI